MTEPDPKYTATIEGTYFWFEEIPDIPDWLREFGIQRRRALITEIRAWDELLGVRYEPRKER